jgi:uncharacterized protein with ATP-grasp and redox domains
MACFVRQSLDAARLASPDPVVHERIVREVMGWAARMDFNQSPPAIAQRIHRRLRELSGERDPYREPKAQGNRMALHLLPELKTYMAAAADPLETALKLAVAGNVIDLGAKSTVTSSDLQHAVERAMTMPLHGSVDDFKSAVARADTILYLADNAGEIVFDRLLIEQLSPDRVTLAVRGAPIINDATREDAEAAGLHDIVEVIDNGSDAPGTLLEDCSDDFRRRFDQADLIIAKGQGNFETLSRNPRTIFFLFKAKCPVIATHVQVPLGTHVLGRPWTAVVE